MRQLRVALVALLTAGASVVLAAPAGAATTTTITLGTATGPTIPAGFVGLTIEASAITTASPATLAALPAALAGPLTQLGPSSLRLGGTSSDYTTEFADPSLVGSAPSWATDGLLTTDDLAALAAVLNAPAAPWSLDLGVNLRHAKPALDAAEVKAAASLLGRQLGPISIGNEPEFYDFQAPVENISFSQYLQQWLAVRAAISAKVPAATFDASDLYDSFWLPSSGTTVHQGGYKRLAQYTYHYYPYTDCNKQPISPTTLLSGATFSAETGLVSSLRTALATPSLPISFDEFNSVSCGSYSPVEHEQASALWGLRSLLVAAKSGVASVGVQTNLDNCSSYTPLCWSTTSPGTMSLQPLFQGLEVVHDLEGDAFVPTTISGSPLPSSVGIFGLRLAGSSGHHAVVIDNGSTQAVTVSLAQRSSSVTVPTISSVRTLTGPSLTASTGVTLSSPAPCTTSCSASSIIVPAATAEVVTLSS